MMQMWKIAPYLGGMALVQFYKMEGTRHGVPIYPQKSLIYPKKSPIYPQKSLIYPQKSPTYPQKSPVYPQRALCICKRALHIRLRHGVPYTCVELQKSLATPGYKCPFFFAKEPSHPRMNMWKTLNVDVEICPYINVRNWICTAFSLHILITFPLQATISRLLKIRGLFLQKSHMKETIFCKRDL